MPDLLVNLYEKEFLKEAKIEILDEEVKIKKILSPDSDSLVKFVLENFTEGWASEIKSALYKSNPSCFVAVKNQKIIGFSCYDATAKGYFGPTGIDEKYRGLNIGQVLYLTTLDQMRNEGYGYAIIGGAGDKIYGFYSKHVKCLKLDYPKSIYSRMISK